MKRVTIKDIANHLSISVSTVSRALANDKNIRRETRDKIFRAADELNYRRNRMAVSLRSGRTQTVGVVVEEMLSPYVAQTLRGLQNVLQPEGINILVACSHYDCVQEQRNIQSMISASVDGIVIYPCHGSGNIGLFQCLIARGMPMVFMGRNPGGVEASEVVTNDYDKAYFLVEQIVRSGRKKIAHVSGNDKSPYFENIRNAYADALKRFDFTPEPDLIVEAAPKFEGGVDAADRLLDSGREFDAVFVAGDLQAIGVMNRLLQRGVKVPGDVAVAGYAGSHLSRMVFPQLTTVEPPLVEMGEKAAQLLLEKIDDPDSPVCSVTVDAKIELRSSSHEQAMKPSAK